MSVDVQSPGPPVQLISLNKVHHLLASDLNVRRGSGITPNLGVSGGEDAATQESVPS